MEKRDTYILIPSYQPDDLIIELVKKLHDDYNYPIILVNDGSGEKYQHIFDAVKDYVEVILQHKVNLGKGVALRDGFTYASLNFSDCKYVITCDGDGQHAIEDILRIDDKMHKTNQIVFGYRNFKKDVPHRSIVGNRMSRLCRTIITKEHLYDDQCGLRGFPIRYMRELATVNGDHYEYEMNVVCTFQLKKYKILEIPIRTIYIGNNDSSHFKPGLDTYRIQRVIWTYSLIGIISYFIHFGLFCLYSMFWNPYFSFLWASSSGFMAYIGILSFVYPSKRSPHRVLVEGIVHTIRYVLTFIPFFFVTYFTDFPPVISYVLFFFLTFFCGHMYAYLYALFVKKRKQEKLKIE